MLTHDQVRPQALAPNIAADRLVQPKPETTSAACAYASTYAPPETDGAVSQSDAIAPETLKKFRRGYGEHAAQVADEIKQVVVTSAEGILRKARLVFDMKLRLNRKEWGVWLREMLGWFGNEATPYLQIAKTFQDFEPAVFCELEPFVILKLRTKRYAPVVVRLREELAITSQLIQNFIKEVIPKQSRKKKTATNYGEAVLKQHPSAEDGTSYFTLNANLGEKAGSWLQQKLENHTVGQVLDHAAEWEQKVELHSQATRSGIEAEVEYRVRNRVEMAEFALKREIADLKAQLLQSATRSSGLVEKVPAITVHQDAVAAEPVEELPATTVTQDAVASEPIESATGLQPSSKDEVALASDNLSEDLDVIVASIASIQTSEPECSPTETDSDYLEPISYDAEKQRKENVAQNLGAEDNTVLQEGDLVQVNATSDRTWNGLKGYVQKLVTKTCKAVVLLQGDYRTKHFFLNELKLVHQVEEDLSDAIQARAPQKELVEEAATTTVTHDAVAPEAIEDSNSTSIHQDVFAAQSVESASTTIVTDDAVALELVESPTTTTIPQDAVAQELVESASLPQLSEDSAIDCQILAADWDLLQKLRAAESELRKIDTKLQGLNSPLAQSISFVVNRELKQLRSLKVSEIVKLINSNGLSAYYEEQQNEGRVVLDPKYASDLLLQAQSWSDVVLISGSDRAQLVLAVKEWSKESKQLLVQLLSSHLETEPNAFEQIDWIPKTLLEKTLCSLSFTLQKLKQTDNLVDEPELEYISGCNFVSFQNLGTRHEQWVFSVNGKSIPVFGRSEFTVEKF